MSMSLAGKCAVVTGGAQGLGFAIAERLLRAGASVAVWDINQQGAGNIEALNQYGRALYEVCDTASYDSVEAALKRTLTQFPRIDILVNNAGIIGESADTWSVSIDSWRKVIDIDLNGPFYCCRAIVPEMLRNKYGRIVNIASIAGKEGNPKLAAYSAAKAGVIALTKTLGKELATSGILVNAIAPAVIGGTHMSLDISPEVHANLVAKIPMQRLGTPLEVASMVHWLATDEASFTTAAVFDLSGGRATY